MHSGDNQKFGHDRVLSNYKLPLRSEEAIAVFERITTPQFWTHAYLAACHAAMGHTAEAAEQVRKTIALKPEFTVSAFAKTLPYRTAADVDRFAAGLRLGGLPN